LIDTGYAFTDYYDLGCQKNIYFAEGNKMKGIKKTMKIVLKQLISRRRGHRLR